MNLSTNDIRKRFLDFFQNKEHAILESASLVTSDEKGVTNSTLFNTAGVQPLIPYLLGEKHPAGNRLASAQKCIRTVDIEEVGDATHLTFFEMLGNWSLGDYFKKDAIAWSYEFLTSKENGLGLDPNRIYITVFGGNDVAPKDDEAKEIWSQYVPENRIYYLESNWWEAGENGPCGPDTEIFYDVTPEGIGDLSHEEFLNADEQQEVIEVWNNVFMQYEKAGGKVIGPLKQNGVDTGAGLERLVAVINNLQSVYQSDNFAPIIDLIKNESGNFDLRKARIIADHLKAATFLISDGVTPSNTDRGYILRRLIRRAVRLADNIGLPPTVSEKIVELLSDQYKEIYPFAVKLVIDVLKNEEDKFRLTLQKGLREFNKVTEKQAQLSGQDAFKLFSTYGFPIEITQELASEKGITIDLNEFENEMSHHRDQSRTAAEGKFKGGLESHGEQEIKYHTATHLLNKALEMVLGEHVQQKGSNINGDRLRFDFSNDQKMTDEQKQEVEQVVNQIISDNLPVQQVTMSKNEALEIGAEHIFLEKYGEQVSIYFVGHDLDSAFSKEFCGGPHVGSTGVLGKFKIVKEEASAAGIRRIKAVLE